MPDIEEDEPKRLVASPVILTSMHPDLKHPEYNFSAGSGEYHMVEIDKDGNEIFGSDFSVGETTFRTSFATNPSFKIKKNIE